MPTITTVDATWTNGVAMDEGELRRADTAMFLGDGSANGVRGGIVRHGDTSLAVSVNGSDQVTVQAGAAVIPAATGLGAYRAALSAATSATGLSSRNATNPRIDLVVMQIVSGQAVVQTVDGTPGASPSAPALPANAVELARLTVPAVAGGAVTVDSSWRSYASALGGTLYVATAARLPGSGSLVGQDAIAIDTGRRYTWSGSTWTGAWVTIAPNNGWAGSIFYSKRGDVVTVELQVTKATWTSLDGIADSPPLPSGFRPHAQVLWPGGNSSVDNAPRTWTIEPGTGTIRAGASGTGSIFGVATYLCA